MPHRAGALLVALMVAVSAVRAEGLDASRLGIVFNADDAGSREIAAYYASQRGVPASHVIGVHLRNDNVFPAGEFAARRAEVMDRMPSIVQSLALVWSRPFAIGCMSVTTAFAAGYRAAFCEPGCSRTPANPLFDTDGWLPADTVGWWPAMLLPTDDKTLAHALIRNGMAAKKVGTANGGAVANVLPPTAYLVRTQDPARNVRAAGYADADALLAKRLHVVQLSTPVTKDVPAAIAYFTGASQVEELPRIRFQPGAAADHLTSAGGLLSGGQQMSALAWIKQGATASYGTVSEPCNFPGKFPSPVIFLRHYIRGETVLESYWKSVAMPGQGLFIGEPLAQPFAVHHQ